ncbi:MAG: plasmid pRiA4b ORF-3 family protein [Planctomycetota bacterium]
MTTKRSRSPKTIQTDQVYQLKITLQEIDPPVWRRLLVPSHVTLGELNFILQAAMGWTNSHLHQFTIDEVDYSDPQFELDDAEDEFAVTLAEVATSEGMRFQMLYDFGDSWEHEITVEKILPSESGKRYPVCVAGKRACPPDDCGGICGYEDFLEAIRDPKHEEHDSMLEWIGGAFDPEAFDVEKLNKRLAKNIKEFSSWR